MLEAELEAIERVQREMNPSREFKSEVHQRGEGGYDVSPVEEGDPHSVDFKLAPRSLVTLVHSHPTEAGLGKEAGSWDRNVATNVPVNVITVYPGGAVTRIDTRGTVYELKGGVFVPRP